MYEWRYLFEYRTNARDKCGYATVKDVHGLIILPDTFIDPKTNKGSKAFVPVSSTRWDANEYTTGGDWESMEDAGAVFLPAAGFRFEVNYVHAGIEGFYWSSTLAHDDDACDLLFRLDYLGDSSSPRARTHSIRLVTKVK